MLWLLAFWYEYACITHIAAHQLNSTSKNMQRIYNRHLISYILFFIMCVCVWSGIQFVCSFRFQKSSSFFFFILPLSCAYRWNHCIIAEYLAFGHCIFDGPIWLGHRSTLVISHFFLSVAARLTTLFRIPQFDRCAFNTQTHVNTQPKYICVCVCVYMPKNEIQTD